MKIICPPVDTNTFSRLWVNKSQNASYNSRKKYLCFYYNAYFTTIQRKDDKGDGLYKHASLKIVFCNDANDDYENVAYFVDSCPMLT